MGDEGSLAGILLRCVLKDLNEDDCTIFVERAFLSDLR